jgi:hypothetical protein
MGFKLCTVLLIAVVAFAPVQAFAQQNPPPPDGTSMDAAPAAGPAGAVDICGNPMSPDTDMAAPAAPGAPTAAAPAQAPTTNAKDDTQAGQQTDMSSVTGTVLHVEGNLFLLAVPANSSAQTTGAQTAGRNMAVVQLPAGCANPALPEGSQVTAVGTPTNSGILQARTVEIN